VELTRATQKLGTATWARVFREAATSGDTFTYRGFAQIAAATPD